MIERISMIGSPTLEEFEVIKKGHTVRFSPRDAVGGARGLRKQITGRVININPATGMAQVGDWLVPVSKLQRAGKAMFREWARESRKADRKRFYGGMKRAENKA